VAACGCPGEPGRPWEADEGVCEREGTFGIRESIFKISHSKSKILAHFPDTGSDVARGPLQMARVVYEGGRQRVGRMRAGRRAGGARGCRLPAAPVPPLRPAPQAPPSRSGPAPPAAAQQLGSRRPGEDVRACLGASPGVAIAALTTQFIPRRSCAVPYGLPEVLPLAAQAYPDPADGFGPKLERAAAEGAGDDVLDPEGWALWVTGLCLPLPL